MCSTRSRPSRGPGHRCRHNLNYWRFGDYIGIGAGAHGKLTLPAQGRVLRTRKTRVPGTTLRERAASIRTDTVVPADELALEFLMNALRLREGASVAQFEARTGLDLRDNRVARRMRLRSNRTAWWRKPNACARPRRGYPVT